MESKNKNILIGTLLAVVFVMAVGYAAFTQQLTITGSAEINSTWDVHMTQVGASATPTSSTGSTGSVTVNEGGLTATFDASLVSPGDKVTYIVPIENKGTINAQLTNLVLSSSDEGMQITGNTSATSQSGNIRFTVTSPGNSVLNAGTGTANLTVVAEFVDKTGGNTNANGETANLTVAMTYGQA